MICPYNTQYITIKIDTICITATHMANWGHGRITLCFMIERERERKGKVGGGLAGG